MSTPSEILKGLRAAAGLSQAEVARRAGVSQPNLSEIERGLVMPSVETYCALVGAFELSVDLSPKRRESPALLRLNTAIALMKEEELELVTRLAIVLYDVPVFMLEGMIRMAEQSQKARRLA